MKARVKATGEIVEVFFRGGIWISKHDCTKVWLPKELTDVTLDIKEESLPKDNGGVLHIDTSISYWERLKHQYAGMAMQGMMAHTNIDYDEIVDLCVEFAHALVEKMKEEKK